MTVKEITADNFVLVSTRIHSMLDTIADRVFPKGDSGRDVTAREKKKGDFVTVKDEMVDQMLSGFLEEQFGCPVVSEERQHSWPPIEKRWWVIDPVDGTHNLGAGWPIFGIMGAYIKDAVPVFGFIYFPYAYGGRREMYFAGLSSGAWVDGGVGHERIFVDPHAKLEDSFVLFEGPPKLSVEARVRIILVAGGDRNCLSCAISFTSLARDRGRARRTAGVVSLNNKPWDNLPAVPLITEAGGVISDTQGGPVTANNATDVVAANNAENHKMLLKSVQAQSEKKERE